MGQQLMAGTAGRGRTTGTAAAASKTLAAGTLGHECGRDALGLALADGAIGRLAGLAHRAQQVKFLTAIHATVFIYRHISSVSYRYLF